MKDNFFISPQNSHRRHEIFVQSRKTTKYAAKSLHIDGTNCQKKLNLRPQYLYSKILAKLGLKLNAIRNGALSNPLYT